MAYHPIESLMKVTMDSIKEMVDVNTVVGEPVETKDGTVIIPVSRVSFGFVTGGGEDSVAVEGLSSQGGSRDNRQGGESDSYVVEDGDMPFTGGTGAGVSVKPVGFLVVGEHHVRFLPVDNNVILDRLIEEAPDIFGKLCGAIRGRFHGDHGDRIVTETTEREVQEDEDERDDRRRRRPRSGRESVEE